MGIATASSSFALNRPMFASPKSSRVGAPIRAVYSNSSSASVRTSLSPIFTAPYVGSSVSTLSSGHLLRPSSLNPESFRHSKGKRGVFTMVIPFQRGSAWEQPPPDLASHFFKERIIYLGMCLIPAVTELMMAEFLYLQMQDEKKPIYMYINSTGTMKGGEKYGYETEALVLYDFMSFSKAPVFTLCVGNAWGEAALLLAAGAKGSRSALPSSVMMIRQPIGRFQGQATYVDTERKEMRKLKEILVNLYAKHIGKSAEQIEADILRPKYFSPSEAVEYGIIDKVLYNQRGTEDRGVLADLKKANLI